MALVLLVLSALGGTEYLSAGIAAFNFTCLKVLIYNHECVDSSHSNSLIWRRGKMVHFTSGFQEEVNSWSAKSDWWTVWSLFVGRGIISSDNSWDHGPYPGSRVPFLMTSIVLSPNSGSCLQDILDVSWQMFCFVPDFLCWHIYHHGTFSSYQCHSHIGLKTLLPYQ